MASLPKKGVKGANLRKWLIDSIEQLIDYLNSPWLQAGKGINIRRTPAGTIIELQKQSSESPRSSGGTASAQDISATVSGGTATIEISGSTSAVEIVGGTSGNVTISGNTNGQVVIDATGGTGVTTGMPDFTNETPIFGGTPYTFATAGWIIGTVSNYAASDATGSCDCLLSIDGTGYTTRLIHLIETHDLIIPGTLSDFVPLLSNPVSIPIPAGATVSVNPNVYATNPAQLNISFYPCI